MTLESRRAYFDHVALSWDDGEDLHATLLSLGNGLDVLEVGPAETVIDLGCGTGNLTAALLSRLSPRGRVLAVDFSAQMIQLAREKVKDRRVTWYEADARALPFQDEVADRVIGYRVWPHFPDQESVAAEVRRVLKPGGVLHLWHNVSREEINSIHALAGGPIGEDFLQPAHELAALFDRCGFECVECVDDETGYRVTVRKPAI